MRIYEIDPYYHIDLGKIVAIRQFMNRVSSRDRSSRVYDYWIEITIDSGRSISVDFNSLEKMTDAYNLLLLAWQSYVGDNEHQYASPDSINFTNSSV